jgi:glycosyltransferase involved in cell wall biosynthesis
MTPQLVSVILPTHNRPDYLSQAVESVFAQTYPHLEIIVVDDGSDDRGAASREVLQPYLPPNRPPASSPKVTYLYQQNTGVTGAVNRGLSLAQGEYIQRLDDDDRLLPDKIARCVEVLEAKPAAGLVATGYYHIDDEGRRIETRSPCPCPGPARLLNMLMRCISACPGVMVRAVVHQKLGGYRNIKAQDYEMWVRIAKAYAVETIDAPLAEYRRHPGNSVNHRHNQAKMEQDILGFTREQIEATPLNELVPNLRSKPHAYALRAALYLLRDREYVRTTGLAKAELENALRLSPRDALLSLWKGVLAVYGDNSLQPLPWDDALPTAYQSKAEELSRFVCERKRLSARKMDPSVPEMVTFRQRFSLLRSALIGETFRKATEPTER